MSGDNEITEAPSLNLPVSVMSAVVALFSQTNAVYAALKDDGGYAGEPLSAVGEHFPASWEGPTDAASYADPCELTRLRAEVYALREMEATLRVSLRDAMQKIEDMTPAKAAAKPLPIHRALAAKPPAFGLRLLSD